MYQINRTKISDCFELIPYIFNDHRGTSIKTYHSVSFESLGIKHGFEEDLLVESKKVLSVVFTTKDRLMSRQS